MLNCNCSHTATQNMGWSAGQSHHTKLMPYFNPTFVSKISSQNEPRRNDFATFNSTFVSLLPWLQQHQPLFILLWKQKQGRGGFLFPTGALSWTLSCSQTELSISSPKSSLLRAGNPEMLKVRRCKVHWQNSISPACIILGPGQRSQSLAKKE